MPLRRLAILGACFGCGHPGAANDAPVASGDGRDGDFTVLDGGSTPNGGTGTQTRETVVGSTMTLYWRNAATDPWTLLATETDDVLPTGKPGMSFYVHATDQNIDDIGFSDWRVTRL